MPRLMNLEEENDLAEWRGIRGIGGADARAIMGVDPWSTQYSTWLLKTYRAERKPWNAAMRRGADREADARREFEFEIGGEWLGPCNLVHSEYPFLRAQLDDWSVDHRTVLEIKIPNKKAHEEAALGIIPEYYVPQLEHELLVSGAEKVGYVSWDEAGGCHVVWLYRDEEKLQALLKAELEFWERVKNDEPPPLTLRDMIARFDDPWNNAAAEYIKAKRAAEEADKAVKSAAETLKTLANGKSSIGGGLRLTVFPVKGKVDYKKKAEDLQDMMGESLKDDDYRKPETQQARISIE